MPKPTFPGWEMLLRKEAWQLPLLKAVLLGSMAMVLIYIVWPWMALWWGLNSGSDGGEERGVFGGGRAVGGCFWVTEPVFQAGVRPPLQPWFPGGA